MYACSVIGLLIITDNMLQPTPMTDVNPSSDVARSSTCTCESCLKARYTLPAMSYYVDALHILSNCFKRRFSGIDSDCVDIGSGVVTVGLKHDLCNQLA